MGWRDLQVEVLVHNVHNEVPDTPLSGQSVLSVQGSDIEKEILLPPDRGKTIQEAAKLLRERGWVQIFSGYLNQSIDLVRDERVKVPDPALSKYTQKEIQALNDLTWEEVKTLHQAKELFKGMIGYAGKREHKGTEKVKFTRKDRKWR